jgi:hypothetical protein
MPAFTSASGDIIWRTSQYCDGGVCVMVASHDGAILIASNRSKNGPFIKLTQNDWRAFVRMIKGGDFDQIRG